MDKMYDIQDEMIDMKMETEMMNEMMNRNYDMDVYEDEFQDEFMEFQKEVAIEKKKNPQIANIKKEQVPGQSI